MRWAVTLGTRTVYLDADRVSLILEQKAPGTWHVELDGQPCAVVLLPAGTGTALWWRGQRYDVRVEREAVFALRQHFKAKKDATSDGYSVVAHMPGLVTQVKVTQGQHVNRGEGVAVLEAMKMENELNAPADGVVSVVDVQAGDQVDKGQRLCFIVPKSD